MLVHYDHNELTLFFIFLIYLIYLASKNLFTNTAIITPMVVSIILLIAYISEGIPLRFVIIAIKTIQLITIELFLLKRLHKYITIAMPMPQYKGVVLRKLKNISPIAAPIHVPIILLFPAE